MRELPISKKMGLTSFQLKWIAIITMVADHAGAVLYPDAIVLRYIGRIAFPVFGFLLVEGYFHTRDIYKYIKRLGVFALVSEIPYDLAFQEKPVDFSHQNVFFTLFFGVALMHMLQKAYKWPERIAELIIVMWVTVVLKTDYSYKGILLIFLFYTFRDRVFVKLTLGAVWNFLWLSSIQIYGALAMIPIALYNGEKGRSMKYLFYLFYPAHLLILCAVRRILS